MTSINPVMAGNLLNDEFVEVLQRMAAEWLTKRGGLPPTAPPPNDPRPPVQGDRGDGPWVQIVLTPVGGIPAMCDKVGFGYEGTGTFMNGTCGTGTGTAIDEEGDRPGVAECTAYVLEHGTPGSPGRYLTKPRFTSLDWTLIVYNTHNVPIPGNRFITAVRDPSGDWYVPCSGWLFENCP